MSDQHDPNLSPRFCDYEGSEYRTAFWEGRGREYEDCAERIALRKLLPPTGLRLIDIGGGFGRLVDLYSGYRELVLLDYSTSQLRDAQARLGDPRIVYVAANLYAMPFAAGAFDTVVMVRVLHHLADVPGALHSVSSLLRPGGSFVLEYANKRHLKAVLRYLLRRTKSSPFDPEPCEFVELNYNFHPSFVERHLREAGLQIERQLSVSCFRVAALKRTLPAHLLATVDGWLQQPLAPLKCTPSVFLRSRIPGIANSSVSRLDFRCPRCGCGELQAEPMALACPSCGRRWSTADGIYDFRQPLD